MQELACPRCRLGFSAGTAFCTECGTALGSPAAPPPAPARRARSARAWLGGALLFIVLCSCGVLAATGVAGLWFGWDFIAASPRSTKDGERLPPPLLVSRGERVGAAEIEAGPGGKLSTSDGLEIVVPPGAFDKKRNVRVSTARVKPPSWQAYSLLDGKSAELTPDRFYDIDVGEESGLFRAPVEVSYPLPNPGTGKSLLAVISVDGRRWLLAPSEHRNGRIVIKTRHFSLTGFLALKASPLLVAALPLAALIYLVAKCDTEMPTLCDENEPFISLPGAGGDTFSLWWSKKIPGVSPDTGLPPESEYRRRLDELNKKYAGRCTAQVCGEEAKQLTRKFLYPDKVLELEDALFMARDYLDSRGFKKPWLELPIYLVPSMKDEGLTVNPYSGRRYAFFNAANSREATYRSALHELMHLYQIGYVWWDRDKYMSLSEASATLVEREADPHYRSRAGVTTVAASANNARLDGYRRGINCRGCSSEAEHREIGYSLTWFLEYLRDTKYAGPDKSKFHVELLEHWSGLLYDEQHRSLLWAAGGSSQSLATAFDGFARTRVLEGMKTSTHYGNQYFAGQAHQMFVDPFRKLDPRKAKVELGDAELAPLSINYYELVLPAEPSRLAVRVPRSWAKLDPAPGRVVYVGKSAEAVATIRTLGEAEVAPGVAGAHSYFAPTRREDRYLFVVDTGQSGTAWFVAPERATVFVFDPPSRVQTASGAELSVRWVKPKHGRDFITHYRVYASGQGDALADVDADKTRVGIPLDRLGGANQIQMTSAILLGVSGGKPLYLESGRSGAGTAGAWAIVHGALPGRWKTAGYKHTAEGWASLSASHPSRLVLELVSSWQPPAVTSIGELYGAILVGTPDLDRLKKACDAAPPRTSKDAFNCIINSSATPTTVSGFKAHKTVIRLDEQGIQSEYLHWLVQVDATTWVRISGGVTEGQLPGGLGSSAAPGTQKAAVVSELTSIVGGLRIERR